MQSKDINEILSKINEMRAVFVLGQRAIPFLEEIFVFLREISPLLSDINSSIRDSASKMPRATSQLQSVSNATELATTEILDLIDGVIDQLAPLRSGFDATSARIREAKEQDERLESALERFASDNGLDLPDEIRAILAERRETVRAADHDFKVERAIIEDVRSKIGRIMISLQVQDITAQQIASVNHLIESIRSRMTALITRLGRGPHALIEEEWPVYAKVAFDPNARYDTDARRQEMIDDVVSGNHAPDEEVTPDGDGVADDEFINQLLAARGAEANSADPEPKNDAEEEDAGPASQAEIDALFSGFSS